MRREQRPANVQSGGIAEPPCDFEHLQFVIDVEPVPGLYLNGRNPFGTERLPLWNTVSISGYHIAEAGANPISQLAFTLSNGLTIVEYYLARGMHIDEFAPNLSFFFSNGMDPEYTVIGRVARRIWARAMRERYGANERSQKLKYHIQTSGRSLHAQEIQFNDIRTTLQALYAIYDNCNSLHTNAYDEAITTPTEESERRAMAIQLIINKELGLAKNENPLQGSFVIDDLTDLVARARSGSLRSSEMSDPTITVTNLGDQGVDTVFGVIYPPQVAIVGCGAILQRPWVVDGEVVARPVMRVTLGADHRVSNGHQGARFLSALDRHLQEPDKL